MNYKTYSKILKYLALSLFAYVLTAFIVKPDWGMILKSTVIPQIKFSGDYLLNVVAILGTTISPYLFFGRLIKRSRKKLLKVKFQILVL